MKIIHPKRIKDLLYRGNKPSDGEVKVTQAGQAAKKIMQKATTPSGSRRPRNKGRS